MTHTYTDQNTIEKDAQESSNLDVGRGGLKIGEGLCLKYVLLLTGFSQ